MLTTTNCLIIYSCVCTVPHDCGLEWMQLNYIDWNIQNGTERASGTSFRIYKFSTSRGEYFGILEESGCISILFETIQREASVFVLWWTSICDRTSSLRSHIGRDYQRCCDKICVSKWIPCRTKIWLGLSRPTNRIWGEYNRKTSTSVYYKYIHA